MIKLDAVALALESQVAAITLVARFKVPRDISSAQNSSS